MDAEKAPSSSRKVGFSARKFGFLDKKMPFLCLFFLLRFGFRAFATFALAVKKR
jgi:hypothetical protein